MNAVEKLADKLNITEKQAKDLIFHIEVIDLMEKIIIEGEVSNEQS